MKYKKSVCLLLLLASYSAYSQDGKILEKNEFPLPDSVVILMNTRSPDMASKIISLKFSRITYLSDGLKVTPMSWSPGKQENIHVLFLIEVEIVTLGIGPQ